jgi:hypothetical protein
MHAVQNLGAMNDLMLLSNFSNRYVGKSSMPLIPQFPTSPIISYLSESRVTTIIGFGNRSIHIYHGRPTLVIRTINVPSEEPLWTLVQPCEFAIL